jgi:hypothetical protein
MLGLRPIQINRQAQEFSAVWARSARGVANPLDWSQSRPAWTQLKRRDVDHRPDAEIDRVPWLDFAL